MMLHLVLQDVGATVHALGTFELTGWERPRHMSLQLGRRRKVL